MYYFITIYDFIKRRYAVSIITTKLSIHYNRVKYFSEN